MTIFSIMQGRLGPPEDGSFQSFPTHGWRDEFEAASLAGLDGIEWIYDEHGSSCNPLIHPKQTPEMLCLIKKHGVAVRSVCADYFMDHQLLQEDPSGRLKLLDHLKWLLERCRAVTIERIVLPFVDVSRMVTPADQDAVVEFVTSALSSAEENDVEIHLETDLAPVPFSTLLNRLNHPMVFANYDSGNSAALGFDCKEELLAYGTRIGSVHIKDRVLGGGTVALGEGNANLPQLFRSLTDIGYQRDFVLQVARGTSGDEILWARQNLRYVQHMMAQFVVSK
jgi:L-ribulose-5-phosphate 3-epimerase